MSFNYIECDVPEGQTLLEWRREIDAARRAERYARRTESRSRRVLCLPRPRLRWRTA